MGLQQIMGLNGNIISNMNNNNNNNMGQNNEEDMNRNNGYNMAQGQGVKLQGYDFGYLMQQGQQNMNNNMN